MFKSFTLLLLVAASACVYATGGNGDNNFCCGPVNLGSRTANSAAIYNTPVQVQTSGANDRYWMSSSTSQTLSFPGLFASPFPDPTGLQTTQVLRQFSISFGSLGLKGRKDVVLSHMICKRPFCTDGMVRYGEFYADVNPKPALAYISFNNPVTPVLSSFNVAGDAIAYNSSATDPKTGCKARVRSLHSNRIPNDPISSDAIQNGDLIHTSVIVSQNKLAPIGAQMTDILITLEDLLSKAGADRDDLVYVYVYLLHIEDKAAADVAWAAFFAGHSKPARIVQGAIVFVRPQQVGYPIGVRAIARTPETNRCPNPLKYVSNPQVFAEPSTLATQAVVVGDFIYTSGVHGTKDTFGPESINPVPKKEYVDALANLEYIASEAGADRHDIIFLESCTNNVVVNYATIIEAVASFWNWTTFAPPTVTLDSGTNKANVTFELAAVFYKNWNNYAILPTPYPWAIFGLLTDQIFGLPIGTVPNNTFCTSSSLITCPKPGFFSSSYPMSNYASLGSQGESVSEHHN